MSDDGWQQDPPFEKDGLYLRVVYRRSDNTYAYYAEEVFTSEVDGRVKCRRDHNLHKQLSEVDGSNTLWKGPITLPEQQNVQF